MIAEYERAQILERSRRGKRHRARQGQVSVLSGAPFGYRYVRKSEQSAAYYEINEVEAPVVRWVYERYTIDGLSIGAITRLLNEQRIPTRKQTGRWERSTVWAMLRNPAYKGAAGFGKTQTAPRQRITRPLRLRGGIPRFRCLAPARPTALPQPPDPPRSSRSGRMDRDRQAARRARPDPERARPPAGGRTPHRSDKASRRWASARSRSSAKEHRAPAHRLPRRPAFAR